MVRRPFPEWSFLHVVNTALPRLYLKNGPKFYDFFMRLMIS